MQIRVTSVALDASLPIARAGMSAGSRASQNCRADAETTILIRTSESVEHRAGTNAW